jgi:hypothetical protein
MKDIWRDARQSAKSCKYGGVKFIVIYATGTPKSMAYASVSLGYKEEDI